MVLASGCFDGLHAGHVRYLEAAAALCDEDSDELLVVAVAPDPYIQTAKHRPPHWKQADRVLTVGAIDCVDAAIAQAHPSVAQCIRDYRPRMFVKGPDWYGRLPEDVQLACAEVGTSIAFVDTEGTHVSETTISDDAALARFESIVLSQKRADKPWAPVTDYSFEARKQIEGQHPQLIKDTFNPTRVLDVGCGPGHLMRLLRELGVEDVQGMDKAEGYDIAEPGGPLYASRTHDLVICREVLEHLTIQEIHRAVTNMCDLSSRFVYLTTRFKAAPDHFLDLDTSDDLDPTHISITNQAWLRHLFVLEGFRRRADLEQKMDWQKKGRCLVYERA